MNETDQLKATMDAITARKLARLRDISDEEWQAAEAGAGTPTRVELVRVTCPVCSHDQAKRYPHHYDRWQYVCEACECSFGPDEIAKTESIRNRALAAWSAQKKRLEAQMRARLKPADRRDTAWLEATFSPGFSLEALATEGIEARMLWDGKTPEGLQVKGLDCEGESVWSEPITDWPMLGAMLDPDGFTPFLG